ncbi:nucleoprotein/polynucleotide-associated enzyme, partial [Stenotrophomonas maltophilia]
PGQSRGPGQQGPRKPRSAEEMDLAKAYAIRAQREKEERIETERLKQEEARVRREAKAKLEELLKDKGLNSEAADIARHFPYGGKIKRIYVTAEQLTALNAGELGVVQLNGRYLLVTAEVLAQSEAVFAASVALKVDPNAPAEEDPYADPQYQVPDDLVW